MTLITSEQQTHKQARSLYNQVIGKKEDHMLDSISYMVLKCVAWIECCSSVKGREFEFKTLVDFPYSYIFYLKKKLNKNIYFVKSEIII